MRMPVRTGHNRHPFKNWCACVHFHCRITRKAQCDRLSSFSRTGTRMLSPCTCMHAQKSRHAQWAQDAPGLLRMSRVPGMHAGDWQPSQVSVINRCLPSEPIGSANIELTYGTHCHKMWPQLRWLQRKSECKRGQSRYSSPLKYYDLRSFLFGLSQNPAGHLALIHIISR